MNELARSVGAVLWPIVHADQELLGIVTLSLRVSVFSKVRLIRTGINNFISTVPKTRCNGRCETVDRLHGRDRTGRV